MTVIDQYLGPVPREDRWWVRWVRIDPTVAGSIQVRVHEGPLACLADRLDLEEYPALSPTPLDVAVAVRGAVGVPAGCAPALNVEGAALLRAEHDADASSDRWVNAAVGGWWYLSDLRGHE